MTLDEIIKDLPRSTGGMELAGALIVLCTKGTPVIYRTMDDDAYKELLRLLNDVKPVGTIQ